MTRRPRFFVDYFFEVLVWLIAVFAAAPIWAQSNRVAQVEEHGELHLGVASPWFLGDKTLTANSQMRKEGFE